MNIKIPAIATAAVLLAACGGPGNESAERAMMNAPPAPSPDPPLLALRPVPAEVVISFK